MMTKVVSATEFKANCLRLIDEIQRTGETVTITRHGKEVATMSPAAADMEPVIGRLRSPEYRFDWEPGEPAGDPADWSALG